MTASKLIVRFAKPPAIGTAIIHDGQVFEVAAREPYTRKDGAASVLLTWRTGCRECGAVVEFKLGKEFRASRRNCDEHKWRFPTSNGQERNPA